VLMQNPQSQLHLLVSSIAAMRGGWSIDGVGAGVFYKFSERIFIN